MFRSIMRLSELDDDVVVLPGHNYGPERFTSIANERSRNLAFRCNSAEQFRILAGVAPARSKYNMGDKPGARTARRGGGGGGATGAGASGSSIRIQPTADLFRRAAEPQGRAVAVCPCAAVITAAVSDFPTVDTLENQ